MHGGSRAALAANVLSENRGKSSLNTQHLGHTDGILPLGSTILFLPIFSTVRPIIYRLTLGSVEDTEKMFFPCAHEKSGKFLISKAAEWIRLNVKPKAKEPKRKTRRVLTHPEQEDSGSLMKADKNIKRAKMTAEGRSKLPRRRICSSDPDGSCAQQEEKEQWSEAARKRRMKENDFWIKFHFSYD